MTTDTQTTRELITIDALDAQLETNIRAVESVDEAFVESVRNYGVLVPVVGYLRGGVVHIRMGQRRTLAAQQTGQLLPVILVPATSDDAQLRVVEQLIENEQRQNLTTAERTKAWAQLEFDGMSITKIAGATGHTKETIKAGLSVAKNGAMAKFAAESSADLLHLAALIEFGEYPEVVETLLEVAVSAPDQFEHRMSAKRQQIAAFELGVLAVAGRVTQLLAEGVNAIAGNDLPETAQYLSALELDPTVEVDPQLGDGIVVVVSACGWGDGTRDNKMVLEPAKFGYLPRSYDVSRPKVELDDDAKLVARAARRRVISHNKAWDAASPVRERWITIFVANKNVPSDLAIVTALVFTRFSNDMQSSAGHSKGASFLGLSERNHYGSSAMAAQVDAHPAKAAQVTLGLILGHLEMNTSRETWRSPSKCNVFFLEQLRSWGYALSPIERVALGEEDEVDDDEAN